LVQLASDAKLCCKIRRLRLPLKDRPGSRLLSLCMMYVLGIVWTRIQCLPSNNGAVTTLQRRPVLDETRQCPPDLNRGHPKHQTCFEGHIGPFLGIAPLNAPILESGASPGPGVLALPSIAVKTHPPASQQPLPSPETLCPLSPALCPLCITAANNLDECPYDSRENGKKLF
jgi:hypothetical protein